MPVVSPKREYKSIQVNASGYNTRLQKGGALLDDMRLLVRSWQDGDPCDQKHQAIVENILAKHTRARALDTFNRTFIPRYVNGTPKNAWKLLRELEDRNCPIEILRPIYYWVTAKNEQLLYEFVVEELIEISKNPLQDVAVPVVAKWLQSKIAKVDKSWTTTVSQKVARGLLASLRDFGILEGASKKKLAPTYIPIESFAYLAFQLYKSGVTSQKLLVHPDWQLFLFPSLLVERMFLEADRRGLLCYNSAGKIVRIEFSATNDGELADVIASRSN